MSKPTEAASAASREGFAPFGSIPADVDELLKLGEQCTVHPPVQNADGSVTHFIGEKIHPVNIPALNPILPSFVTQDLTVVEPQSFKEYITAYKSTAAKCFASLGGNKIVAQLDYHGDARMGDADAATAGRMEHRITLACPFDVDYAKWRPVLMGTVKFSQSGLAEFIEDTIHTIHKPAAADLLEAISDLRMDRAVKFKSTRNEQDGTFSIAYEELDPAAGSAPTSGKIQLPKEIEIVTPIFQGGPMVALVAKLRHTLDKGAVIFRFAVPGLDNEERTAFRSIGEDVREQTGTPVFYTA